MSLTAHKNYTNSLNVGIQHFPYKKIKIAIGQTVYAPRRKTQNEILANLSPDLYAELEPLMQKVSIGRGQKIFEPGSEIDYVYFPDNLIASRIALMADGSKIEVGMLGHDGVIGIRALLGTVKTECLTLAENEGTASRIQTRALRQIYKNSSELQNTVLRFYEKFLVQVSQRAACRCRHTILKQLSTWLLQFQDKSPNSDLSLTQETIAQRLGARRSSVTVAINDLETKGMISCGRGNIEILDRSALIKEACECYAVIQCESAINFPSRHIH